MGNPINMIWNLDIGQAKADEAKQRERERERVMNQNDVIAYDYGKMTSNNC